MTRVSHSLRLPASGEIGTAAAAWRVACPRRFERLPLQETAAIAPMADQFHHRLDERDHVAVVVHAFEKIDVGYVVVEEVIAPSQRAQ